MVSFSGLSAFPITPAAAGGRVDGAALAKLIARLVKAEVDTIGLLGSTGAYMYFDREQRRAAIEIAMDASGGKAPLIVGIGALCTDDAVMLARDAKAAGASAGLLAPVSYTPLKDSEVFEHYSTVAAESGLPIVIYDNPITTHFRFTPQLISLLAKVPNIAAVKCLAGAPADTSEHLNTLRSEVPASFAVGYSADVNCTEAMLAGADTWYSVLAGTLPKACLKIVRAAQSGDEVEARRLNAGLAPIWELFRQHSSIRVVYALAEILGICSTNPPRPILPLPSAAKKQIAEVFAQLPAELAE